MTQSTEFDPVRSWKKRFALKDSSRTLKLQAQTNFYIQEGRNADFKCRKRSTNVVFLDRRKARFSRTSTERKPPCDCSLVFLRHFA
jgi:hypothetical protein